MGNVTPAIIEKGGKDIDGQWGEGKTFVRESYYLLEDVPLPLFMLSPFIPVHNSFHPLYPFAIAKDSRISCNLLKNGGQGVTVSTTYQILKPNLSLMGLSGWNLKTVINYNLPHLLPAQDVKYTPMVVEETQNELYVEKTQEEILSEADELGILPSFINTWKVMPFRTTAGTKLTGTITRNILKMSFWYFVPSLLFDEAELVTQYTGVVNSTPRMIAGRFCPIGTAKIESIEVSEHTWERPEMEPYRVKMIKVVLLLDNKTWEKKYENVSNLFMAYPYEWENSDSGKEKIKMKIDEDTNQPIYDSKKKHISPQRIFCTTYDPEPTNEGDTYEPIWVQEPQKVIQFFGTREECFRLNPDSEPTEVSEPMYLDEHGFILYPDPDTGKVDTKLSPKMEGYKFKPMDFSPLHFPAQ